MTKSDFYGHVFLGLLALGLLFWWMMAHLGKKNCVENPLEKHIVLKVFGGLSIALGLVMFVVGVVVMTRLEFPEHSLPQPLSPNMIIRPSWKYLHIGYPTKTQSLVISVLIGTIQLVGLGLYLWCFRRSGTRWWQKMLKIVAYTAMFLLLPSATDFHYYDIYEFISPILFIVLATVCLVNWQNKKKQKVISKEVEPNVVAGGEKKTEEIELNSMDVEL